jgi:hypothetical protein
MHLIGLAGKYYTATYHVRHLYALDFGLRIRASPGITWLAVSCLLFNTSVYSALWHLLHSYSQEQSFFVVENIVFQFFSLLLKMSSGASALNESSQLDIGYIAHQILGSTFLYIFALKICQILQVFATWGSFRRSARCWKLYLPYCYLNLICSCCLYVWSVR